MKLVDYCSDQLIKVGAEVKIIKNDNGTKANLFATVGPRNIPGVLLSGHTDVVPIEGQSWTIPAFEMTKKNNWKDGLWVLLASDELLTWVTEEAYK